MKAIKINNCSDCAYGLEGYDHTSDSMVFYCGNDKNNFDLPNYPAIPPDCTLEDVQPITDCNRLEDIATECIKAIDNVHEAMEGRYELDGEDLHTIQYLLSQLHNYHHPDTGKEIDKILNTITPEEQAKCDADMIEVLERNAALAAWMAARSRYVGYTSTIEIAVKQAFEKWYDQWKEAGK